VKEARLGASHDNALLTMLLVTGDDAAAVALLVLQPFVQGVETVRDGVACRVAPSDVPRIAPVLVAAGIAIHAISPRKGTLEDLYLSHYGSGTEVR
jgi:hypothetical protein